MVKLRVKRLVFWKPKRLKGSVRLRKDTRVRYVQDFFGIRRVD